MISEAAKSTRILDIYNMLLRGQAVHKKELAEKYQVNSKSIQRDLESIRDFLSEQYVKCGVRQNVEYDRANDEYRLVTQEVSYLSQGEMLAVSKILLESRAFSKEQITSLLSRIENLCVSEKERRDIEQLVSSELFNYHTPAHAEPQMDMLWTAAEAVMEQKLVEVSYADLAAVQFPTARLCLIKTRNGLRTAFAASFPSWMENFALGSTASLLFTTRKLMR